MTKRLNGELLTEWIRVRGVKKRWVAAQLDVSETQVNRMEKGHVPKKETLEKLEQLIGKRTSELLIEVKDVA